MRADRWAGGRAGLVAPGRLLPLVGLAVVRMALGLRASERMYGPGDADVVGTQPPVGGPFLVGPPLLPVAARAWRRRARARG
jgi:hypothetical protein